MIRTYPVFSAFLPSRLVGCSNASEHSVSHTCVTVGMKERMECREEPDRLSAKRGVDNGCSRLARECKARSSSAAHKATEHNGPDTSRLRISHQPPRTS